MRLVTIAAFTPSFPLSKRTTTGVHGRCHLPKLSMGPVFTAVVVYIAEKFILRLAAGQIFRKGVTRKTRRLLYMILEVHVLLEIVQDVLEDFSDYTNV
jgi:hypothetical protein